jgi:GT2 family glycosyltransferase
MLTPLMHIVIPAYGSSPYLESAIDSAIASVSDRTPITVLDDASPTGQVKETSAKFHNRVDYIRNETNLGLAANFFEAFKISQGLFTVVLGSDDQMLPGYETALASALDMYPNATVIHPTVEVIDDEGESCQPLVDRIKKSIRGENSKISLLNNMKFCRKLLIGNFMYFPATAWRTEDLRKADWNLSYKHAVDMDLLFKLAKSGAEFVFTPETTFNYRRHSESVSSVLANEDTRLNEELAVHWLVSRDMRNGESGFMIRAIAQIAPTIRIHALIIGMKQITKNPFKGFRHIAKALAPIKPI